LQLENFNRLKLHFFRGLEGISLVYYEDQGNRWAAYATTRDEGKPTPKSWAITATDDDRCRRTEFRSGGPIELRCRDGELILSRGDVVLLAAPLSGSPSDVFFEGRATIHGIALLRTKDAPQQRGRESMAEDANQNGLTDVAIAYRPLALRPDDLEWNASKPDVAAPEKLPDGEMRFSGDRLKQRAACLAPLPNQGLHEVILELTDVMPGTGVYLGRENGKPEEVVRFYRDRRSGQLGVRIMGAGDQWEADFDSAADKPTPLMNSHCWLRLLYGCGNVRWWLSSDGVHWAQTEPARDNAPPGVNSIGLQLTANCPGASITVKRVVLRPLKGLHSLAKPETLARAVPAPTAKSLPDWIAEASQQKPADVEAAEWLRACTIRTLAAGARRELAYPLLEALLDDAADRDLPLEQQLAALDDAMLMALELRDGQAMRVGLLSRYPRLGIQAADRASDGSSAWSSVRAAYYAAPVVTRMQLPTDLDRVIRWELIADAYRGNAKQTLDFIQRLKFFHQYRDSAKSGLAEWVESLAAREVSNRSTADVAARTKESWREPLVEELSKEAYNALTELKAVVDSQAWEDAARLVAALKPGSNVGLAPYGDDRSLLVSLPVAARLSLEDHPPLRQALTEKLAPLAKLRIAEAIHAGNAAAIELATVLFDQTPPAADAHRWLADQALVAGHFARAISHYERALALSPASESDIAPRRRLAAAMLGRDAGTPLTESVKFGEVTMSAKEFEALVAEMRAREKAKGALLDKPAVPPVPKPATFTSHVRSRLDGPVGERPQEEVGRRTSQFRVPWVDRQIATAVEGDTLYMANHFQLAAYSLKDGKRVWQSQPPTGPMQRAQQWAMIPMRPLVGEDRIFVRLLYGPNPLLICIEKSSGKLLWTAETHDREFFVSDPFFVQGQLVALGISIQQDQEGVLRLWLLDQYTGETLRQRDLARLRNTWGARACCEVAANDDGFIAALGGVTLAGDAVGKVRWIRKQISVPAEEDPRWVLQLYDRPLVHGDRVYVAQPGMRTVECLSAATGRRYWSAVLPEVVGLVGISGDGLIVRTENGVRGLALADGAIRWRQEISDLFSFQLLDDDNLLLARRERMTDQADQWQVRLTWLNPADGKPRATSRLPELTDNDPRLGPLVPYKDRLFTFFGRGQTEPTRDFIELVPSGTADHAAAVTAWGAPVPAMFSP
jgi:outer membrane protein assembly factor BamB